MDAVQFFAYTEPKGPCPDYINFTQPAYDDNGTVGQTPDIPDVVVTVRDNGTVATISIPRNELEALHFALGRFLAGEPVGGEVEVPACNR